MRKTLTMTEANGVAVGLLIAANSVTTQYLAAKVNLTSWWGPGMAGFYWPWQWSLDLQLLIRHVPDTLRIALGLGILVMAVPAMIIALTGFSGRRTKTSDVHGSAHFASHREVRKTGLLNLKQGVFVGGWDDGGRRKLQHLRHNGTEPIVVGAPPRSGKGTGIIVPTMLTWEESSLVLDVKGELWALTSGAQKAKGHKVLRFAPGELDHTSCSRWNALDELRADTPQDVSDAQVIAQIIMDPEGKGLKDHWDQTGSQLLTGLILHLVYKGRLMKTTASLSDLPALLADPNQPLENTLNEMLNFPHQKGRPHLEVQLCARRMLNKPDRERASVVSTVEARLALYGDPVVAEHIRESDFSVVDLMHYEVPLSLYLVIRPQDLARFSPLLRLLVTMVIGRLTADMDYTAGRAKRKGKYRLLMLLDEFPALGKVEIIDKAIAFLPGYGIKLMLICQDLAQLQHHYGKDHSLVSTAHIFIAHTPNNMETAQEISKRVGQETRSKNKRQGWMKKGGDGSQETSRSLMTADEVMRLGSAKKTGEVVTEGGEMLVFESGHPPIRGRQILFFKDPFFAEDASRDPPERADRLRKEELKDAPQGLEIMPVEENENEDHLIEEEGVNYVY